MLRHGPNSRTATLHVDASVSRGEMRDLQGAAGMPGPARGAEQIPDLSESWRSAHVALVRTYDWLSRLDTVDNPNSLFPDWSADPTDPANYNFAATDAWVRQVQAIGADILFTLASSVPSNRLPAQDPVLYQQVVENIVRHYTGGWGGGDFVDAVTHWEFGDQPDFGRLHFDGTPEQFYGMCAAAARAVKKAGAHLRFGGPCIAFPLDEGPYREGLLDFVRAEGLPLDFLTWMWFTDDSRDPLDFRIVAARLRGILDARGFEDTELVLAYWNMTGIPNAQFLDADAAAFQTAAAVYMQDSVIDRAVLFRADAGTDLHYGIIDPAGIRDADGGENARTTGFELVGRALSSRERLEVSGGDEDGFAVLAGRSEQRDVVRVLLSNYAIPHAFLTPRERDVLDFQVPVGSIREEMSFTVLPRRTDARSAGFTGYTLSVANLPWGRGPHRIVRHRADGKVIESRVSDDDTIVISGELTAPAVELIEISSIRDR